MSEIDLHLLRCLDVLVTERHVTRSAELLGMTQSGMSTALARLRGVFNDPILVRTPQGMQLSEHALEIAGAARRALSEIDNVIASRGPFVPATSSLMFSIMASDYVALLILPQLIKRLQSEAPSVVIKVVPPEPSRVRESLSNSEADLVVGYYHDIAEGLYQSVLLHETLACVLRLEHPEIGGPLSVADYIAGGHVIFGSPPAMVSSMEVLLERTLPSLGIERRVVAYAPALGIIPRVIATTDLLATLPLKFANSFANRLPLQVLPLPFEVPVLPVRAIWHERMHGNTAHRWLRSVVQEIGRSL